MSGKPAGILDQHRSDAVALDAVEESEKAWPRLDGIGAADGRVIEGIDNRKAGVLGVGRNGVALALVAAHRHQRWLPSSCAGRQSPACGSWEA